MKSIFLCLALMAMLTCIYSQADQTQAPPGMVLIPGGSYMMGHASGQGISTPAHPVTLPPFFMDTHEVSNHQYAEFCKATGHKWPEFWGLDIYKSGPDYPDYPVIGVSHFEAAKYAAWAGKRLPSEAEWEYAARGGALEMDFPYGPAADREKARYNDPNAEKGPLPVGSFEPNEYGLYDMAGNVWEWVEDWFGPDYYRASPQAEPKGPGHGQFRVFRGGGWHSGASCTTVHRRNALPEHWVDLAGGFRCVRDVDKR
jgi:formylglycine-generating enzyme required for sulfatase activity